MQWTIKQGFSVPFLFLCVRSYDTWIGLISIDIIVSLFFFIFLCFFSMGWIHFSNRITNAPFLINLICKSLFIMAITGALYSIESVSFLNKS